MLKQIGQIAINVRDVERATAFYRDVLGLKFLFPAPHMAFFEINGVWLMLSLPSDPEFDHAASILYFDVDDIGAVHESMKGKGAEFRTDPHLVHRDAAMELWLADFRDTEGNTLCLRQVKQP